MKKGIYFLSILFFLFIGNLLSHISLINSSYYDYQEYEIFFEDEKIGYLYKDKDQSLWGIESIDSKEDRLEYIKEFIKNL